MILPSRVLVSIFQSTLPLRGATRVHVRDAVLDLDVISIHTPLAGSDFDHRFRCFRTCAISIHTPLAGSDIRRSRSISPKPISIHTPLAGSDRARTDRWSRQRISIHTPLAGSDFGFDSRAQCRWYFNPHSPCGERRAVYRQTAPKPTEFQSTLPLRGATRRRRIPSPTSVNFNPHSPCGERPGRPVRRSVQYDISIHTPLAGSDQCPQPGDRRDSYFNPHSPCGERLADQRLISRTLDISIHTPLAGSDLPVSSIMSKPSDFNPHSPCGERHQAQQQVDQAQQFQSTLPLRGATAMSTTGRAIPN